MIYVVDTVQVDPEHVDAYVALVQRLQLPAMKLAGATFVSARTTAADLGEIVDLQFTWSVADFVEWNKIRKELVLNPRWHEFGRATAPLRTSGTRRFFTDLPLTGAR
jgi:hypothetical protein